VREEEAEEGEPGAEEEAAVLPEDKHKMKSVSKTYMFKTNPS